MRSFSFLWDFSVRYFQLLIVLLLIAAEISAQDQPAGSSDSTTLLNEVTVSAFRYDKPLLEVPVAVTLLAAKDFERFSNTSLLPAMNSVAGVRMEERSPGSYRFSIRGSLLRSPFGVRNVKMYWNGLPLTDGGGNTYLNLIDFQSAGSVEIIKGPGGSLYGAGTGGVVLLGSAPYGFPGLKIGTTVGSFGLQRYNVSYEADGKNVSARVQFTHQKSDGYRVHTKMRRDAINADLLFTLSQRSTLAATILYTDLFYETPGGLTKDQFYQDDRQSRANAETLKASIQNKTVFAGATHDYQWNDKWSTRTGVYGAVTNFENPTFLNYEGRQEKNVGARMENQYHFGSGPWSGRITFGEELQFFKSPIQVNNNNAGNAGDQIISDDKLTSRLFILFAQAEIELPAKFFLTVGMSNTLLKYSFRQYQPDPSAQTRKFDPVFSPRVALLRKITNSLSVYGSVSHGFSPPSLAEVRPSTNNYNNTLNPERGYSYEAGVKGSFMENRLNISAALYHFGLDETIIIQRTDDGADFFINAGKTNQRGLETSLSWSILRNSPTTVSDFTIWASYTDNHYRFQNYINDEIDYSGNAITGVAPSILVGGLDFGLTAGFYINITASWTDAIPLNDANSEYASDYFLLGSRFGYRTGSRSSRSLNVFTGIDNALDKRYSLGNDLNARGGRYYNAAAGRNFFIGFTATPFSPKKK